MKKNLSIIFLGAALFATTSCVSEEDLLFDKSAAERLNEASDLYSQRILDSKHGWALEYFPHSSTDEDLPLKGAGFLMLAKFEADKSVVVGMYNFMSHNTYEEDRSVWEVITDNGPVLSFNSHNNCIHAFSVPEDIAGTSEDETGKGMEGDYEFVMVDVPENGDYILLKGKKRGAYSRMTRLDEETDFQEYLTDVRNFTNKAFDPKAPNNVVVNIGEESYNMIMAQDGGQHGIVKMWPCGSDSTFTKVVRPILVTRHGTKDNYTYNVRFRNAIKVAEEVSEQEFVYDANAQKFIGVTDSNNSITGPDATEFMAERIEHFATLNFAATMEASTDITNALNAIKDEFGAVKYTFNNIKFKKNDDGYRATVAYRNNKKQNVSTNYDFNFTQNADGSLSFQYVGPNNASGESLLNSVPSIATFFNLLSGSFKVTHYDSPLNLSTVKFYSGDKFFVTSPTF